MYIYTYAQIYHYIYTYTQHQEFVIQQRLSNFHMLYQNEPVKYFDVNKMRLYKVFTIHLVQILQVKFNNRAV